MNRHVIVHSIIIATMLSLACVGCSDKQQLRGKVTFSDDGSPVPVGSVFFETPTFVAQGDIKPNGTYVVGSTGLADGIPLGEYGVYIAGAEKLERKIVEGEEQQVHVHLIDGKYLSPRTSGLKFVADGKTKRFDIKVDRAAVKPTTP